MYVMNAKGHQYIYLIIVMQVTDLIEAEFWLIHTMCVMFNV
jgi:hypothetical protein